MCGILAVIGDYRYKEIPEALIERGRDDQGVYQDDHVQLMQTRLEITPCKVKLPFQHKGMVLLFNGEIYNWRELSEEVGGNNEYEVIINSFIRWGNDLHLHLDGQFYIIIYNPNNPEQKVYHFQDPFKIHTVYYDKFEGSEIYASNLRSLPEIKLKEPQHHGS